MKAVLPGEDKAAFEKLQRDLVDELAPVGAMEHEAVATMGRLTWRARHLTTCRRAERAQAPKIDLRQLSAQELDARIAATEATIPRIIRRMEAEQAGEEVDPDSALMDMGKAATLEGLMEELDAGERLQAAIDRQFKRLCMLKAYKSLPATASSDPVRRPNLLGHNESAGNKL
jgi:hypothetical protein